MNDALFWLLLNFILLVFNGYFSMIEMACVSLSQVRLHYWVAKKERPALRLNWLLQHPFRLFGTTLIGVNITTTVGSECAREFHRAIGLPPDIAPLSQVLIVIIFGELAPMFAARLYPEHVAWLSSSFIYYTARLMTPVLWIVGWLSKAINMLIGAKDKSPHFFLSKEELQKVLEEKSEEPGYLPTEDINLITTNIFHLRDKLAKDIATLIKERPILEAHSTVDQARSLFSRTAAPTIAIWQKSKTNIIGILAPRNLIRAEGHKRARDYASPPWFVTENAPWATLLKQFQHNRKTAAVVVNHLGQATGLIELDDLIEELFGHASPLSLRLKNRLIIERTFPGDMSVGEFKEEYGIMLDSQPELTLSDLMTNHLGRHPEEGETVSLKTFELTAKECSLLDVKSVTVKTRI